jgi:hypothetical protein
MVNDINKTSTEMSNNDSTMQPASTHKPRPMIDLMVSLVIPSVILMKFSGAENLGATAALIVALTFPLSWGLFEFFRYRQFNFIALLGLISIVLTGGIGLLQLDPQWLAIKEAAIPGLIGTGVLLSTYTRYPLIRTMVYNPKFINVEMIRQRLKESDNSGAFESRLQNATYLLSSTFLFSSAMNYILATVVVTSPAGSASFNEELGRMTLLSYPVIAIPSTLMMIGIFYYLWRTINGLTGLKLEEVLASTHSR